MKLMLTSGRFLFILVALVGWATGALSQTARNVWIHDWEWQEFIPPSTVTVTVPETTTLVYVPQHDEPFWVPTATVTTWIPPVTHIVNVPAVTIVVPHYDAVPRVVHHDATWRAIEHELRWGVIFHPEVSHVVHHPASTHVVVVPGHWDSVWRPGYTTWELEEGYYVWVDYPGTEDQGEWVWNEGDWYLVEVPGENEDVYVEGYEYEVTDSEPWDETVVDSPAYDEYYLVSAAYVEWVIATDAYDETVIDFVLRNEIVVVEEARTIVVVDVEGQQVTTEIPGHWDTRTVPGGFSTVVVPAHPEVRPVPARYEDRVTPGHWISVVLPDGTGATPGPWTLTSIAQDPRAYFAADPVRFLEMLPDWNFTSVINGDDWGEWSITDIGSFVFGMNATVAGNPSIPMPDVRPDAAKGGTLLVVIEVLMELGKSLDYSYVVYEKTYTADPTKSYFGQSFGRGSPQRVMAARDSYHHRSFDHGPARLRASIETFGLSDFADFAMHGREQSMVDSFGGLVDYGGRATNEIRPVGRANLLGYSYWLTANAAFGQIHAFTGFSWLSAGFVPPMNHRYSTVARILTYP